MTVQAPDIEAVTKLYEPGLYVQAYARAVAVAPLEAWDGPGACLIAGRLAMNVGAPRLARVLHARAWRADRSSAEAAYFRALALLHHRGPRAAWHFLENLPPFADATPGNLADLDCARCSILTLYRDFEEAARHLDRAWENGPDRRPWFCVVRADLLKARDRYPEALAAAHEGLRLSPWYRPAVQSVAEVLPLLGRDAEAVALLQEALQHIESPAVATQLAVLQGELGDAVSALASWKRVEELSPAMEPEARAWWHGRISDARYACGDLAAAAVAAARAGTPFFAKLHRRLTSSEPTAAESGKTSVVLLPVPFVRQHHMTCAPATLSALSVYFEAPIDHLALAQLICYDGTPDHRERHWLEENGWVVREFRVTWEAAVALLDRGLPFTLVTVATQSAHLQAVIGYDGLRGTLLIRDPFQRTHGEAFGEEFLARYASSGPRGMVLVPAAQANRIAGLTLPDEHEYDRAFQVRHALHEHRRAAAAEVFAELSASAPGHRLTLEAGRWLAWYDADTARALTLTEELLQQFPEDSNLLLAKLGALRELGRTIEADKFLRSLAAGSEPLFWREWAQVLARDAREHHRAYRWLARGLRVNPLDANTLWALGDLTWTHREFRPATTLYRRAACLQDKSDGFAQGWLRAARHLREAEPVLELLTRRFEQNAARSAQPARTLFWALCALDRQPEAFTRLEEALTLRPEDGELLLLAADAFGRIGDFERASKLLAEAEPRSTCPAWLRAAATLADFRCDLREALRLWSEVLAAEPLAMDAHPVVARLMAETAGREAARAFLAAQVARFPHHLGLRRLAIEWTRESGPAELEQAVRDLLALHPNDAWAHREMALLCGEQKRFPEATEALARAEELERHQPLHFAIRARLLREAGDLPAARAAARQAIELSVDYALAMNELLWASDSYTERRESVGFIRSELIRQVVLGQGLLTYRELAFPILEPAELLAGLQEAHAARPDLWHAWTAVVQQLVAMNRLEEALPLATETTERFPLLVTVWLTLARVSGARGDFAGQVRPLRRALVLQPSCGEASRALAAAHEHLDDLEEARRVLEQACAATPLDAHNQSNLARVLAKLERWDDAATTVERSLRLDPQNEPGWELLRRVARQHGDTARDLRLARELTELRPGEPRAWLRFAGCLPASEIAPRLEAIDQALAVDPKYVDGHDARAIILASDRRWREALAACTPPAWPAHRLPLQLRGRRPWIEAQSGDLTGAIAHMQELVTAEPDYYWGWNRLADWHSHLGNLPEATRAAEQMSRLAPQSVIPLGYRASLRLRAQEREEAIVLLRQAFDLDPSYEYAALNLFEQQCEAQRFDEAGVTLERMKLHQAGPATSACEVRLLCTRKQFAAALEVMRELCFSCEEDAPAVESAARTLLGSGRRQQLEDLLLQCLQKDGVNPAVGRLWGRRMGDRGGTHTYRALRSVNLATVSGKRAYLGYLDGITKRRDVKELERFLRANGPALRADDELWGEVGGSFISLQMTKRAALWFEGWEKRAGLHPWLLLNIAIALRSVSRTADAAIVSRHALNEPRDHSTPCHQLWLASDAVIQQRFAEAESLAQPAQGANLDPFYGALRVVVNAGLGVQKADPAERRLEVDRRIANFQQPPVAASLQGVLLKPVCRQTLEVMAQLSGQSFKSKWMPTAARATASPDFGANNIRLIIFLVVVLSQALRFCSSDFTPSSPGTSYRAPNVFPTNPRDFSTPVPRSRDIFNYRDPMERSLPSSDLQRHRLLPMPDLPPIPDAPPPAR